MGYNANNFIKDFPFILHTKVTKNNFKTTLRKTFNMYQKIQLGSVENFLRYSEADLGLLQHLRWSAL